MGEIDTSKEAVAARLHYLREDDGSDFQRDSETADLLNALAAKLAEADQRERERNERAAQLLVGVDLKSDPSTFKTFAEFANAHGKKTNSQLEAQRDAALAELARLKGENEWRPIDDDTPQNKSLLLWWRPQSPNKYAETVIVGQITENIGPRMWWDMAIGAYKSLAHVTHWRPLPTPPATEGEG